MIDWDDVLYVKKFPTMGLNNYVIKRIFLKTYQRMFL